MSAQLWAPDLTLCGAAAASATWWPNVPIKQVELSGAERRTACSWLRVSQGEVDPDWVMWLGDYKVAKPAMSAVQAAMTLGGNAIDEALRWGISLSELWEAFHAMPKQKGKAALRLLLKDSRDEPWSELEREAHRLLRQARITGWKTNHRVTVAGQTFFIDIAFPGAKIAIELDGHKFHSSPEAFERDRIRQNLLVEAGWKVLRFTWATVHQLPEMVLGMRRK